ncbi:hypothetical protein H9Q13_12005 [Pontibacter sp. JH31]|uniref:Uncharacterized protein n=1 Tax=Pontibacter aquaedesilientis TaxID=2766980 RepID=A0ABR7XIY3_9BACT|nr:hypothetical protein [Pontibacter aquaedesilientis]MBD1397891.1 hypothetical protein [Pontibacter aquaedesilientis]
MKRTEKRANLIQKEHIPMLHFGQEDVLKDPTARSIRHYEANRATILGNAYRNKALITFCTDDGEVKQVETTVWCYDDNFVLLKSGTFLPLKSILKIENC